MEFNTAKKQENGKILAQVEMAQEEYHRLIGIDGSIPWISVEAALPEDGQKVMVYKKGEHGCDIVTWVRCVEKWRTRNGIDFYKFYFSHWMPLPPLPEGEE